VRAFRNPGLDLERRLAWLTLPCLAFFLWVLQGEVASLMANVQEVHHSIQYAKSSVSRDAKAAANAAAQAEAWAAALSAALPLISGVPGLGQGVTELEEAIWESQQQTTDALSSLGQELLEVRALAEQRLLELRGDAEGAVEALSELSVANAAAQHSAMNEQYVALQAAEERAAELEGELDNARVQVRSRLATVAPRLPPRLSLLPRGCFPAGRLPELGSAESGGRRGSGRSAACALQATDVLHGGAPAEQDQ